jgi:nitroreductase
VGLTSIHWREAWKYGERAFRYCQHDTGHAIAALRFGAALLGWRLTLLPQWSDADLAALLGLDRDHDFPDAEREEPECLAVVTIGDSAAWMSARASLLVDAATRATWRGVANQLSSARVDWPAIDAVASATRYPGLEAGDRGAGIGDPGLGIADPGLGIGDPGLGIGDPGLGVGDSGHGARGDERDPESGPRPSSAESHVSSPRARSLILQRRSALGFDARSTLPRATFFSMLARLHPSAAPWDAIDWPPHINLLIFVHRVDGLVPGLYAYLRDPAVAAEWRAAMRQEFLWEATSPAGGPGDRDAGTPNLFLLVPTDVTWVANRLSCDQDIAADGFFSLGMIARVESSLRKRGEWFYRRLFWETGVIGQVLYLEAEAAGARATGIGCFYDDAVHEMAGLSGHEWQSLYHFSMGVPVDDDRLTTEPGYAWDWE